MYITITIRTESQGIDIRIDSSQYISEGFKVAMERGLLGLDTEPYCCFSKMNERIVSLYKTFAQENIYSGDCLSVITK
jgi:hypothetical protein